MYQSLISTLFYELLRNFITEYSRGHVVERGCPQRRSLSPHLWNFIMNSLLEENDLYTHAHADDGLVLMVIL